MKRKEYDGKQIILFHTSKFKITFDKEVAWTLDGEYGGSHKEVITHNLEKAIRIYSPPGMFFIGGEPTDIDFDDKVVEDETTELKEKKDLKERFIKRERKDKKDSTAIKDKSSEETTPPEIEKETSEVNS